MKRALLFFCVVEMVAALTAEQAFSQVRSGKFGAGGSGSYFYLDSDDVPRTAPSYGGALDFSYSIFQGISLRSSFGAGTMKWSVDTTNYITNLFFGAFFLSVDFLPNASINPFLYAGGQLLYVDPQKTVGNVNVSILNGGPSRTDVSYLAGVGFDICFSEFFGMTLTGEYVLSNFDNIDGLANVKSNNDNYVRVAVGFKYYFFDGDFMTKMLNALKARYEGGNK
jgi:hypothetical protein